MHENKGKSIQKEAEEIISNFQQLSKKSCEESNQFTEFSKNDLKQRSFQQQLSQLKRIAQQRNKLVADFTLHAKNIQKNIKRHSTSYLIYFIAEGIFKELKNVVNELSAQYQKLTQIQQKQQQFVVDKKKQLETVGKLFAEIILVATNQSMQTLRINIFKDQDLQQWVKIRQQSEPNTSQKSNFAQKLQDLIDCISLFHSEQTKSNKLINKVYDSIIKYEGSKIVKKSDDIYEEVGLNWLKQQLQHNRKDKQYLCCKTIFFNQGKFQCSKRKQFGFKQLPEKLQNSQVINQQIEENVKNKFKSDERVFNFRNEKKIVRMTNEQQEIAKTITALMNQKGGAIFLGITAEPKAKQCLVSGFQISEMNKKQLVSYLKNAINQIMPKHKGFEMCSEQMTGSFKCHTNVFQINSYITFQLINVVDPNSFKYYVNQGKGQQHRYIAKILVKMGHPKYMYYILKNESNKDNKRQARIQFYIRGQQVNEKQTLQRCYDNLYKKLIDYEAMKATRKFVQRPQLHEGCRYDMALKEDLLILKESEESDDQDD